MSYKRCWERCLNYQVVDDQTDAATGRVRRRCCGGLRLYEDDADVRLDEMIQFTSSSAILLVPNSGSF
jgi:hypothetical protein